MGTTKKIQEYSLSYLTFKISGETFAANVANVQNIQEMSRITTIPKSPDYYLGVINLRGNVLPVMDLRKKLDLEITENTTNTCILVMEVNGENKTIQMGMLVDEVDEVIEIASDQIQPPPTLSDTKKLEILKGFYKQTDSESFIMILNVDKIFTVRELDDIIASSDVLVRTD